MKPNKLQTHGQSQNISHLGQKRRAVAKADTAGCHRAGIRQFLNKNFKKYVYSFLSRSRK